MSNKKLVRKVLRTLPKKFAHKVTNGSGFDHYEEEGIGIALKATLVGVNDEDLAETMNLLAKNFKNNSQKVQQETIPWKCVITKPTIIDFDTVDDNNEDDEEMTEEELLENYQLMYTKWMELTMVYTKVDVEKYKLKIENEKLRKLGMVKEEEVHNLKDQVSTLNKGLKMMNLSTNILEEILVGGKEAGDSTSIVEDIPSAAGTKPVTINAADQGVDDTLDGDIQEVILEDPGKKKKSKKRKHKKSANIGESSKPKRARKVERRAKRAAEEAIHADDDVHEKVEDHVQEQEVPPVVQPTVDDEWLPKHEP
ncbi:hypothetical protein LIER_32052 [Lithospermum erythrorhizon]|uniref:Gag-pol polyprotein n=1 Tax=Lithospermum erythrorhizon TaxID=34254 RepID=A0AAV3RTK5_LITER